MRTLLLLLALLLAACPRAGTDDDDSADDDDSSDDDDDSSDDDDATADDDDSVEGCPAELEAALAAIDTWTIQYSCASAFLSVGPADESVRIALNFDLNQAPEPALDNTYALVFAGDPVPKNGVPGALTLQSGANLFAYDCTDVIEEEPVVLDDLAATSGSALLTVTEYNDAWWWSASVSITGVTVEGEGGTCVLPDHTWTELGFGWLPG